MEEKRNKLPGTIGSNESARIERTDFQGLWVDYKISVLAMISYNLDTQH